ncbi:hypothetical protein D3C71_1848380 [compost metagenome]
MAARERQAQTVAGRGKAHRGGLIGADAAAQVGNAVPQLLVRCCDAGIREPDCGNRVRLAWAGHTGRVAHARAPCAIAGREAHTALRGTHPHQSP